MAYKVNAISMLISHDEVIDVSILHPLRDQSKLVFTHCHSKEWQDIGMPEVFPSNTLSTEPL